MKLEESVKQGLLHNTQQSVAEYDQGIENIHNSIASLDNMNVVERKMLAMLDKYGAEPGFEQALRALDPDTVSAKLINAKVVPDRPGVLRAEIARIKKEGARGLITGRLEATEALRAKLADWEKVVRDNRDAAVNGQMLAKIDGPGFPVTKASQQTLHDLANSVAVDCTTYSYISKVARGTLGW